MNLKNIDTKIRSFNRKLGALIDDNAFDPFTGDMTEAEFEEAARNGIEKVGFEPEINVDPSPKYTPAIAIQSPEPVVSRRLISTKQVAAILGVTPMTVQNLCNKNKIPYIRIGHLFKFDPKKIDDWIEANFVK